jgi:hypothetical protein
LANGRFLTDDPNLVNIDADNFNLAIPEFDGLKQTDQENAAARVHDEASQMTKMAVAQAVNGRYDIVYDSTTSGQGGLNTINQLGAAGYKMDAYFVDIPLAQAFDRAATREHDSTDPKNYGRHVPADIVEGSNVGSAKTFFAIKDNPQLSSISLVDNSQPKGQAPTLVYERVNSGG